MLNQRKNMKINSIKDLIDALEQLGAPEEGYTRFFRGHSNAAKYKLEPSIYREDNKYYTQDAEVELKTENLNTKINGKGYIRYVRIMAND